VHTAGVTADGSFEDLDWDRFRSVLDPKVRGGWHLHRATEDLPLDFFVAFSSVASLVGTAGQANYVVANAFLDALAAYRRARRLPATSVSWGPWRGAGMAERSGLLPRLTAAGYEPMTADQALDGLAQALTGATPHVGVARIDWRRLLAVGARRRPYTLLADLAADEPAEEEATPRWRPEELTRLAAEQPEAAHEAVLGLLLDGLAALLRLGPADREALRPGFAGTRLNQLGLDSLTTVQLRNRLLADLSADVPAEQLLGGATAAEIAGLVCQQLVLRSMIAGAGEAEDGELEVLTL
jgi:hypothetical protein